MWSYALILLGMAVLVGLATMPAFIPSELGPLFALLLLTLALTNMALELPFAVSLSLAFAPVFAGILLAGPLGGALLGVASAVSVQELRERKPLELILINVSQLFIAGAVSGQLLLSLGGRLTPAVVAGSVSVTTVFLAAAAAVSAFFVLNLVLVGIALSLKTGMSTREVVAALGPGSYWVSLLVLALLGYVMAYLIAVSSWIGVLLLVLPFLAARRTFRVYAELTEAYTSTVRSLVAAIEAKDPYTKGHSERVAVYAGRLAERLALTRPEVELLERAALLHDVGKIGIELDTLTSPTQLSAEEVRAIRQHPIIGAELVGDVDFLSDIVPIVRHHHERFDGAGYPDGLVASSIPRLARVLAVADSYDAMTSNRAYRLGMTQDEALVEISRVAGTQLDAQMAAEFAAMLVEARGEANQA